MSNKNSDVEIIDLGLHPYADTFVKKISYKYQNQYFLLSVI